MPTPTSGEFARNVTFRFREMLGPQCVRIARYSRFARLPYFASPKLACRDDLDPLLFVRPNKTIFRVLLTFVWRRQCVLLADTVYGMTQWIGCRKNNIREIWRKSHVFFLFYTDMFCSLCCTNRVQPPISISLEFSFYFSQTTKNIK